MDANAIPLFKGRQMIACPWQRKCTDHNEGEEMMVVRYCEYLSESRPFSGDYLKVGDVDLGEFRDIVDAEYKRAGGAFAMRQMFYTGSPFGTEILELAQKVRGDSMALAGELHKRFASDTVRDGLTCG